MTEICHSCRTALEDEGRYCKKCGAARHGAPEEPASLPHGYTAQAGQPAPQPAPPAPSSRSWPAIVGAVSAFVLVTGAIVAVLLTSANGGGGVHAATVLTVTTPQAAGGVVAGQGTSENNQPTQTPASHAPVETGPLSLVAEHGASISAGVPAGWTTLEDEVQKSGYVESKWSNPADSNDTVLIDTSPATHDTLEQDAAPVHDDLLAASGYHELSYGPGNLTGVESWMWQFRISGDQRVDYFFNKCTSGFAVLGSTVPGRFNRLAATFRAVAESVQPGSSSPPC